MINSPTRFPQVRHCVFFYFLVLFFILIRLVEETLEPLDPDRRAFRLVGGVLVRYVIFFVFAYFLRL